jgi:hypothetical protein
MRGASGTAGDVGDTRVAVNARVRVYPGPHSEVSGTVVEDFGDLAGHVVDIGENHIVPSASVSTASKYCPPLPYSLSSLRITFDRRPCVSTCSVVSPQSNPSARLQSPHVSLVRIEDADSNHRPR